MKTTRSKANILGVYREEVFSPGKVDADRSILDHTLLELQNLRFSSSTISPKELSQTSSQAVLCLSMAQSHCSLGILAGWQAQGTRIVNSISSVRSCYRRPLFTRLERFHLPVPESRLIRTVDINGKLPFPWPTPFWIKRADVHAVEAGDVTKVRSHEELNEAVSHFRERHVDQLLVQEHIEGEVIKFYGVGPDAYFAAFRPVKCGYIPVQNDHVRNIAQRASSALGLEIYGGDAVIGCGGQPYLIDLNDWPSFSSCCKEAAKAIAGYVARVYLTASVRKKEVKKRA